MSGVEAAVAWADTDFPVDSDNKKAIDKTHQKITALFLFIMNLIVFSGIREANDANAGTIAGSDTNPRYIFS